METKIEIKAIIQQILEILQYLQNYQSAVIHRDIKPDNIIRRDDGKVFLVDFGGCEKKDIGSSLNRGDTFVGTFGYMSPGTIPRKKLTLLLIYIA